MSDVVAWEGGVARVLALFAGGGDELVSWSEEVEADATSAWDDVALLLIVAQ